MSLMSKFSRFFQKNNHYPTVNVKRHKAEIKLHITYTEGKDGTQQSLYACQMIDSDNLDEFSEMEKVAFETFEKSISNVFDQLNNSNSEYLHIKNPHLVLKKTHFINCFISKKTIESEDK